MRTAGLGLLARSPELPSQQARGTLGPDDVLASPPQVPPVNIYPQKLFSPVLRGAIASLHFRRVGPGLLTPSWGAGCLFHFRGFWPCLSFPHSIFSQAVCLECWHQTTRKRCSIFPSRSRAAWAPSLWGRCGPRPFRRLLVMTCPRAADGHRTQSRSLVTEAPLCYQGNSLGLIRTCLPHPR